MYDRKMILRIGRDPTCVNRTNSFGKTILDDSIEISLRTGNTRPTVVVLLLGKFTIPTLDKGIRTVMGLTRWIDTKTYTANQIELVAWMIKIRSRLQVGHTAT